MARESVRLGGLVWYDDEQEKDLGFMIKKLSSTHRFGEFVTYLLRMAVENPSLIETSNGVVKYGTVIEKLAKLGYTEPKKKQLDDLRERVTKIKRSVDAIYKMCYEMYMLTLMNKELDIENKTDNILLSESILERQVKQLCNELGVESIASQFNRDKLDAEHRKAEESFSYILRTYQNMINELKKEITEQNKQDEANKQGEANKQDGKEPITKSDIHDLIEAIKGISIVSTNVQEVTKNNSEVTEDSKNISEKTTEDTKNISEKTTEDTKNNEVEAIDFGETADLEALKLLLG